MLLDDEVDTTTYKFLLRVLVSSHPSLLSYRSCLCPIGEFCVADATDPEHLTPERIRQALISPLQIVSHISQYRCTDDECRIVRRGGSFALDKQRLTKMPVLTDRPRDSAEPDLPPVAILSPCGQQLLALGEIRRQGRRIQPRSVFLTDT